MAAEFPGSEHVRDIGLADADDEAVWIHACHHDQLIVSKDVDFYHRSMLRGCPPRVVWLRIGNAPTSHAETLLRTHRDEIAAFGADSKAAFLILPPET